MTQEEIIATANMFWEARKMREQEGLPRLLDFKSAFIEGFTHGMEHQVQVFTSNQTRQKPTNDKEKYVIQVEGRPGFEKEHTSLPKVIEEATRLSTKEERVAKIYQCIGKTEINRTIDVRVKLFE